MQMDANLMTGGDRLLLLHDSVKKVRLQQVASKQILNQMNDIRVIQLTHGSIFQMMAASTKYGGR